MINTSHLSSSGHVGNSIQIGADTGVPVLKDVLMKKLTWIVFFAYALLMFKPVLPVVLDAFAHTFWEQQHMLVVHEVNGKFHVHNELVNAVQQSEKDKKSVSGKFQVEECIAVALLVVCIALMPRYSINRYAVLNYFFPFCSCDLEAPPPRFFYNHIS